MSYRKNKSSIKQINQSFNQSKILKDIFTPYQFDVKLASNPFLKDQQKFQFLLHKIKEYNKAVLNSNIKDSYQSMVYDRLYSLVSTLSNLLTKDIQIDRLNQIYKWFIKQDKLLIQRRNQGNIRYKVIKQHIDDTVNISMVSQTKKSNKSPLMKDKIVSQVMAEESKPFRNNWRTAHKQLNTADIRILEYHRKTLKMSPFQYSSEKQAKKMPRITYPKIQRLKYTKQIQIDLDQQQGTNNENPPPPTNPQNPQIPLQQGDKKQGELMPTGQTSPAQPEPQQDLGLGQEPPEQPQQQQQQQVEDKLAPRLKNYIFEPRQETKQQNLAQKRMNERYIKIQNDFVRKQKDDTELIQLMHNWAARKTQLDKQILKRLQIMKLDFNRYDLCPEDPPKQQPFSIQDAKKYGLSKTFQIKKPKAELDLSSNFQLPAIKNKSEIYEKSIRRDKLNILKKKFGKMLNLQDYEQREVSRSMCQIQEKRKGFSQILRKHSKSKERIKQLDQVMALKQKLARDKVSIDITALSNSLCCPEDESITDSASPTKALLSNPFWVQPAKKKKKK